MEAHSSERKITQSAPEKSARAAGSHPFGTGRSWTFALVGGFRPIQSDICFEILPGKIIKQIRTFLARSKALRIPSG